MTLLLLSDPERSSPAHPPTSNHSLVRHLAKCGRLQTQALKAGGVAEAAVSRLQAEAKVDRSRRLHDAEACEARGRLCNAERVEWDRSAAEGAALLSVCEAAAASSAASCEAAGQEACEREREQERERVGAEGVAAVSECEATAASCQAERLSLEARVSELSSSELLPRASELVALRAAGKACEERAVAAAGAGACEGRGIEAEEEEEAGAASDAARGWEARGAVRGAVAEEERAAARVSQRAWSLPVKLGVAAETAAGLLAVCGGLAVSLWWWWWRRRRRRAALATAAQAEAATEAAADAATEAAATEAAAVAMAAMAATAAAAAAAERARLQARLESATA